MVVILDKHFHLGLSGNKTTAPGATESNKSDSASKDGRSKNSFDEQSGRAAEVIRAAGYVFFLF